MYGNIGGAADGTNFCPYCGEGGQLNLFEPEFIKDMDCTKDTPVIYGVERHIVVSINNKLKSPCPSR